MENNVLGTAIKLARESRNLSKASLALYSKTTSKTIANIETGIHRPNISTLLAINSVLKCDLSIPLQEAGYSEAEIAKISIYCKTKNAEVIDFQYFPEEDKELIKSLLKHISKLSKEDKSMIRSILQSRDT